MSETIGTAQIEVTGDARGFDSTIRKAKDLLSKLGQTASKTGQDTAQGMGQAAVATEKLTAAQQKQARSIELQALAMGKTRSEYLAAKAAIEGNSAALASSIAKLREAERASASVGRSQVTISEALGKVGPAVAAAFAGGSVLSFAGKLITVQREFDVLNSSLKTVTGSSEAAEREMAWLKDFAKETPFGLAQATQGFVKMKALGLDPTRASLTSFGNTASAMGKSLSQMIEAVADASTGEFERLKEFGVKASKEGDSVKLTFQGISTTIGNSAAEITRYLEDLGNNQFAGAMAERANTLDGAISSLADTWDELFRVVSKNNTGGLIYDSVKLAEGAVTDLTTIIQSLNASTVVGATQTGAFTSAQNGLATVFETVAVLGANVKYVLVQVGNELGGLAAQAAQILQGNFSAAGAIRTAMVADAEAARREIDATTARILNARREAQELARYATRNASAATDPRRVDVRAVTEAAIAKAATSSKDALKAAAAAEKALAEERKRGFDVIAARNKAVEEAAKAEENLAKAHAVAAGKEAEYAATLRDQVTRQLEQNAAIGLTAEELVKLEVAKLNDAAASKERLASDLAAAGESDRLVQAYREQAAELRKLAAAKADGGAKQANVDAADVAREAANQATEDWKRAAAEIENDITDALMRGFESGKGFAENLRDTVVNMFKTMVLRPLVQMGVQGGLNLLGLGGPAAGSGGGGGALGALANGASLYSQLSTGTGLIGSVLASNAAYGAAIGTTTIGAGSQAAMLAAQTGSFGAAGVAATSQAAAGAGAGASSVLSAIPGWGWALGGLALLAGSGFGKTPGEQARGGYYSSRGLDANMDNALAVTGGGGDGAYARDLITREDAGLKTFTQQTVDGVLAAAQGNAKALGVDIALGIDAGFAANLNGKGKNKNAFGYAQIFADGELAGEYSNRELGSDVTAAGAKFAAELADTAAKVVLAGTDFGRTGETASATLTRLGDSLTAANGIFDTLGTTLFDVSLSGGDMASQLADAFGGMERLTALAGDYYQSFYSDAERTATTTRQVSEALAELGLSMPESREGFRALVEAQDLTTESGRETYAALLNLAPAFASVATASEQVAARIKTALGGLQSAADQFNLNAGKTTNLALAQGQQSSAFAALTAALPGIVANGFTEAQIQNYLSDSSKSGEFAAIFGEVGIGLAEAYLNAVNNVNSIRQSGAASTGAGQATDFGAAADSSREKWQNAFDVLSRTVDVQRDLAQQQLEAASAVYDLSRDAARSLRGEVDGLRQQSAQEGQRFIEQALSALSTTGYLPDQQGLGEAIDAARGGLDSRVYASAFEQDRDRLVLAAKLQQIADLAEPQKTAAEQQLEYLDGLLDTAQQQLDALNGVKDANLSLADALEYWVDQTGKPLNVAAMVSSSSTPTPNVFAASPPPVTYLMQSGSGNAEMVAELRALRVESAALRERLDRIDLSTSATSRSTERAALVLDDAARGKQALSTVTT